MFGSLDIARLRGFVAACEEEYDVRAPPDEIHPVSGAAINSHFRDSFPDGCGVTGVAAGQPLDTRKYAGFAPQVCQSANPSLEYVRLAEIRLASLL